MAGWLLMCTLSRDATGPATLHGLGYALRRRAPDVIGEQYLVGLMGIAIVKQML